jgi:hypothetical protein
VNKSIQEEKRGGKRKRGDYRGDKKKGRKKSK